MFSVRVSVRVRVRVSVRFIVRFRHFQVQKIRRSARPHFTRGLDWIVYIPVNADEGARDKVHIDLSKQLIIRFNYTTVNQTWYGFTLGVRAFEAWLYTFMSHKSH